MLFRYKNSRKLLISSKHNDFSRFQAEKDGDGYEILLEINPEEGSKYELIVDYAIIVGKECKFVSYHFMANLFEIILG